MLAPVFANDDLIELIENSGIQFIDREFVQDSLSLQEGLCLEVSSQAPLISLERNEDGKIFDPSQSGVFYDDDVDGLKSVDSKETLAIYNGVWFPIPYFVENSHPAYDQGVGPFNWARCRVVRINDPERPNKRVYRAVFAFDTKTIANKGMEYSTPLDNDVRAGLKFKFCVQNGKEILKTYASGHAWGKEWISKIYQDALQNNRSLEVSDDELERLMDERMHEAHYLNMLTMLKNLATPPVIKLKSSTENPVGVTLVLDIGNSRSCGILMEDSYEGELKTTKLSLRDLNAPEELYQDAFESRVEFSVPNFDYDGFSSISGREDAFIWPSIVRTGFEASKLASMRKGNEGATGLSSPKRYIWNDEHLGRSEWCFSPYSYQIPYIDLNTGRFARKDQKYGEPYNLGTTPWAWLSPMCDHINALGDALFACENTRLFKANYSGKSIMTFMLIEIIMQALSQMNSYSYRYNTKDKDAPRYLKALVITTPPSMPDVEREIFRGCAYEALGILWKCLDYDPNSDHPEEFKFITAGTGEASDYKPFKKQLPEVVFDWDEAEAAQIVYLFNETQEVFGGDCAQFLEFLRRHDAKGRFAEKSYDIKSNGERCNLISARIASLDIGGGTTDMVITDYSFPENTPEHSAVVSSREILRDGFKLAGDDILRELIEKTLIEQLKNSIVQASNAQGRESSAYNMALSDFFDKSKGGDEDSTKLQQANCQIFMKIGYRIMSYLERLNRAPAGTIDAKLSGTVSDFILGKQSCSCSQIRPFDEFAYTEPAQAVVNFVNDHFKKYIKDFNILNLELSADLVALNLAFLTNRSRISAALTDLSAVLNLYRPDLLLLTGRPSNISGIRTYFLSRCALADDRVISLSRYSCGSWYSFATDGSAIGDTKTTVAMGAAIAYMRRSSQAYRNFRFDLSMPLATSPVRYFGHIDESLLKNPFYRFVSKADVKRSENKDDESITLASEVTMMPLDKPTNENDEMQDIEDTHVLPDNLGFRQFSYEGYPASMLYSIERITDVEGVRRIQEASNYGIIEVAQLEEDIGESRDTSDKVFKKLNDEQFKKCLDAKNSYAQAINDLRQTGEFVAFQNSVVERYKAEAQAQATAELKGEEPSGMFKALKQKGYEKKLNDRTDEIFMQRQNELEQELSLEEEDQKSKLMHSFMQSVSDVLAEHYNEEEAKAKEKIDIVKRLVDSGCQFTVNITLAGQEKAKALAPVSRLGKLWEEIAQDPRLRDPKGKSLLPNTFRLVLKKAVFDRVDYTEYLNLKLKTVNAGDENYWTDSGRIYEGSYISSGKSVKN